MLVLFDLQKEIKSLDLTTSEQIIPVGKKMPTLMISETDGIKTIKVKDRRDQYAGVGIGLASLPVQSGDRITVTGRVVGGVPMGSWGVALSIEDNELSQFTSPKSLFSLSYILTENDISRTVVVQTTRWGAINPLMDFHIDNILILRDNKDTRALADPRSIIYTLEGDEQQPIGAGLTNETDNTLTMTGSPDIKVFSDESNKKALYISRRVKDYDGIDISLKDLELVKGNNYRITVKGKIDGKAPDGTIITLQGLPGYHWRNNQLTSDNQTFTLRYSLTHAEVNQWQRVRVATNTIGATVSFYIYSIEIKRLGLL